jgi:hypothetical protein
VGEFIGVKKMICPYCKKEYSEKVMRIHIPRCVKNPKNIVEKPVDKTTTKKGKK